MKAHRKISNKFVSMNMGKIKRYDQRMKATIVIFTVGETFKGV